MQRLFFVLLLTTIFYACSNSVSVNCGNGNTNFVDDSTFNIQTIDIQDNNDKDPQSNFHSNNDPQPSSAHITAYLPLNDTEYPYAGIPRIVIETENHQAINDRETEIPAKLQIWGENKPESEIMDLTIRGRGNTSWGMPKKSYKIEFSEKTALLNMSPNKDWALIANYADKSLIRNHLIFQLSKQLNEKKFSPHDIFVELYLNHNYIGVYQLTETIKEGKNRVDLSESSHPFLVEFDKDPKTTDIIITSQMGKVFHIHYPKKNSETETYWLSTHLNNFEKHLQNNSSDRYSYDHWICTNDYIYHYWIQEFSNNTDGDFNRSVFFSINNEDKISMGPVWDFDLSFGNHFTETVKSYQTWRIRNSYWNHYLFSDSSFLLEVNQYWNLKRIYFESTLDSIESYKSLLQKAAENNFKRWNILKETNNWWKPKAYNSYDEAVEDLKEWISNRIKWINDQIN